MTQPLAVTLPGAEPYAAGLGLPSVDMVFRNFPDGESYVRCLDDVRDRPVCLLAMLKDPDPQLMRLLLTARTLKEMGAASVGLVAPYFPYLRQDIAFNPGESVSARHFGALVSGDFDWAVTVDPHLHRLGSLSDVLEIPCRVASSAQAMSGFLKAEIVKPFLFGPDQESQQWLAALSVRSGDAPFFAFTKTRHGDRDVEVEADGDFQLDGHTPVLVDDIASTGQSLLELAARIERLTTKRAVCCVTHALYDDAARAQLRDAFGGRLYATNTVPGPDSRIDVMPDVLEAIMELSGA